MADFAPPPGPPPPKVPEGWKAVWNPQYNEWFYVNVYTKQSQWDKPTEPVYPPGEAPPAGAPPGYAPPASGAVGGYPSATNEKGGFGSNNPYANTSEDEALARRLQEEEQARANGHSSDTRGQSNTTTTSLGSRNHRSTAVMASRAPARIRKNNTTMRIHKTRAAKAKVY